MGAHACSNVLASSMCWGVKSRVGGSCTASIDGYLQTMPWAGYGSDGDVVYAWVAVVESTWLLNDSSEFSLDDSFEFSGHMHAACAKALVAYSQ